MDEIQNMKDAIISMEITIKKLYDKLSDYENDNSKILKEMIDKLSEINYNLENIR